MHKGQYQYPVSYTHLNVKNYSYAIVDGQVYYRENSRMVRPDLNATAEARVKGLVGLRDCVQELIDLQMDAAVPDKMCIRDRDCPDVHLNWEKVAKRITSLVQKDRYLR